MTQLIYLDTGEIFVADEDGMPAGDVVASIQLAILDDDAHALGTAMAAAPDMLKALKIARLWADKDWVGYTAVEAAINKAEGRS